MLSLPKFGAVYVPETEFPKFPAGLGLTTKILNRRENTTQEQRGAMSSVRGTLEHELGIHIGITNRRDGVILISNDDGPPHREPTKQDVFVHRDQTRITSYLDAYNAEYAEGNFVDLKTKTRRGGISLDELV